MDKWQEENFFCILGSGLRSTLLVVSMGFWRFFLYSLLSKRVMLSVISDRILGFSGRLFQDGSDV